jgi:hypothetical protein
MFTPDLLIIIVDRTFVLLVISGSLYRPLTFDI